MSTSFTLRPWTLDDVDSLVKYANNKHIADNLRDGFPHPYTRKDGEGFIGRATKNSPANILTIDVNGEAVGGIGLHPMEDIHRLNAELGYWLAEPFWGQGIVSNAIAQIVDYGFKHWEYTRIFAMPFGRNIASQRVLEKAGFVLEGRFDKILIKNGVLEDELVYAVRRENWKQ